MLCKDYVKPFYLFSANVVIAYSY